MRRASTAVTDSTQTAGGAAVQAGPAQATPPLLPADGASPLLLSREQVAAMLSVSPSTRDAWRSSGRVPPPVIASAADGGRARIVRWSRPELVAWIEAGCADAD